MGRHRVLILGGTTQSRQLAERLALEPTIDTILSLAGRTAAPAKQPVPVRIGGFGGSDGLTAYLREESIDLLIDATHPFAARISANAAEAAPRAGVPLFALDRPAWKMMPGDHWISVGSIPAAVEALGQDRRTVFLAIGRQEVHHFERAPQHRYLVRSVDPVTPPVRLSDARFLLATGPFAQDDETRLLRDNGIDVIVAKNSGGDATYGKIAAARVLNIPVIMVERQRPADTQAVATVDEAMDLTRQLLSPGRKRGV